MRKLFPLQAHEAEWKSYSLPQTNFTRHLSPEKQFHFRVPADWKQWGDELVFSGPYTSFIRVSVQTIPDEEGKWALIGAGIGAGAGTGIGYAKYSPNVDDSESYIHMRLLLGAGFDAIGGLLFGQTTRKRELVYSVN